MSARFEHSKSKMAQEYKILPVVICILILAGIWVLDGWQQGRFNTARRGYLYMNARQYDEAIIEFKKYLKVKPGIYWYLLESLAGEEYSREKVHSAVNHCISFREKKEYQDGSGLYEMQGYYRRIQTADGKWEIINRKDEAIFRGADYIEELPLTTVMGCAIVGGKAVLFIINPFDGEEEIRIVAQYDEYVNISCVQSGEFAFVWTKDGLMGVVDYYGEVIVPAIYQNISYFYLDDEPTRRGLRFLAYDEEGKTHILTAGKNFVDR